VALILITGLGLFAAVLAHEYRVGDIAVIHPWARATIGQVKNGVAYLTISNEGESADRLVGVTTTAAKKAALHTQITENDVIKMRPVESIEVSPSAPTVLEPGGLHIMLMGVHKPLKAGEHFPLTLTFEQAGQVEVTVKIAEGAAGSSDHGVQSHQSHEIDDDQEVSPRVIEVRIENRKVVAPSKTIRITEGDMIELRWTSDEPVELHLHGYDLELHVRPDEPAAMVIEAYATGRFPITSHGWGEGGHGHDALTHLEVYPD
jgi:hypothetical protein